MSLDILIREPGGGVRRSGALVIDAGAPVTETAGGLPELNLGFVGAKAWLMAPATLPDNTAVPIAWDNVAFDDEGFFDLTGASTRATVPPGRGGKYMVVADGLFTAGTAGNREVTLRRNGVQEVGVARIHQGGAFVTTVLTEVVALDEGDYLEMLVLQTSGATLFAFGGGGGGSRTSFTLVRLGT